MWLVTSILTAQNYNLAALSVVHKMIVLISPGILLEMQNLKSHPTPTESKFTF